MLFFIDLYSYLIVFVIILKLVFLEDVISFKDIVKKI